MYTFYNTIPVHQTYLDHSSHFLNSLGSIQPQAASISAKGLIQHSSDSALSGSYVHLGEEKQLWQSGFFKDTLSVMTKIRLWYPNLSPIPFLKP